MSFDLLLWVPSGPDASAEAAAVFDRVLDTDPPAGVPRRPELDAFLRELWERHPDPSVLGDDELDGSPWAGPAEVHPDAVLLSVVGPWVARMESVVYATAGRHGMACFDPQEETVRLPRPTLSLLAEGDGRYDEPSREEIERVVRALSDERWFAVLERIDDGHYVQVGVGYQAGAPEDGYVLEHREGTPDRHFRRTPRGLDDVADTFHAFAAGRGDWARHPDWRPVEV